MQSANYFSARRRLVERTLAACLPPASKKPATLHKAMRYSLLDGGKRLRPILCLTAAEACGGNAGDAIQVACAIECIHTYSLIHDDLPCMDNDDLRRGKPTSHIVFGEAMAVLAGDALLTKAFELTAKAPASKRFTPADYTAELANAAGHLKLIAGQTADMEAEQRKIALPELRFIHRSKTAALLSASLRLGAMCASATQKKIEALGNFGEALGLAFQIVDDILDVTQTSEALGKSAGKDVRAQKATYPSLIGLEASKREAGRQTSRALEALRPLGRNAVHLEALAKYILGRES